jgi:hypothetical protein
MSKFLNFLILLIAIIIPLIVMFLPNVTFHILMVIEFFTPIPFKLFTSPYVIQYHNYLMSKLPEIPELPALELPLEDLTRESLRIASKDYTFPVVIRGALKDMPAIKVWGNASWWLSNYGNENVLCKYVVKTGDAPACTINDAINSNNPSERLYVSGEARIFQRNKDLEAMVSSEFIDSVSPGKPVFTQLFMGYGNMGSDVHAAIGCNMFRQVTGRKKWWLIPVDQTAYVFPSLNPNGFSAHTLTKIGKGNEDPSPWLGKIKRYTVTLNPGDVLLNPPWFWHGIKNIAENENDLVIGVPTRYGSSNIFKMPSLKSNFVLSVIGLGSIAYTFGLDKFLSSSDSFQKGIERARASRGDLADKEEEEMKKKEEMENAM